MKKLSDFVKEYFSLSYDNASHQEIKERIISGGQAKGSNLCILMLATFIASIGLNMNSTAVIIGAMLISPLMGGIMAIGYGIATDDIRSALRFGIKLLLQVIISLITSTIYFTVSPISTAHSELLARTNPTIWDVLIAIFGGLAGIIGITRKEKGNVIPGVAIATALMPPLCTAGYGISIRSAEFVFGALYLFFINSFFICISTIVVLKIINTPIINTLSEKTKRKVHRQIITIGCITVIPSIFLAYQIVNESMVESYAQKYITECFKFDNTEVVQTKIDIDSNTINIALLGEVIDNEQILELQDKLSDYSLSDMTLKITQTNVNDENEVDVEKIKEMIANQVESDIDIETLKTLLEYSQENTNNADFDISDITNELSALYPNIKKSSLGYVETASKNGQTTRTAVVIIETSANLSQSEKKSLKNWLSIKMQEKNIVLYENISENNAVVTTTPLPAETSPLISNTEFYETSDLTIQETLQQ